VCLVMFLSRESFNWNDTYIATTVAGENYSGRLVGRDGESFMMRSDDDSDSDRPCRTYW
jgi:hypothetical protein